eukprot:7842529-Heterocapsa_arctica.AAC.1
MEEDLEAARERLRTESDLDFARAMVSRGLMELKMNPSMLKTEVDKRAWAWALATVLADEAGDPGPGSIYLALGTEAVKDQGYDAAENWGDVAVRPILDDLGPEWGPVSVDNGACVYYDIFDDEDANALPTIIDGMKKHRVGDELPAIDDEGVIRPRDDTPVFCRGCRVRGTWRNAGHCCMICYKSYGRHHGYYCTQE